MKSQGPGETLLSPYVLLAVGVLLLNDHVLKGSGLLPAVLTGKLSDAAGLSFFPLFLEAVLEVAAAAMGMSVQPSKTRLVMAVMATGFVFTGIQLSPTVSEAWRWGWGALQYPFRLAAAGLWQSPLPALRPVASWPDPTDLAMLPFLAVALWLGLNRGWTRSPAGPEAEPD